MGFQIQRTDGSVDGLGDVVTFGSEDEAWTAAETAFGRDPASDGPGGVRAWLQVIEVDGAADDEAQEIPDVASLTDGDYVYRWTQRDRDSSRRAGPSDVVMHDLRSELRTRDLTTDTDDIGIRVVARVT